MMFLIILGITRQDTVMYVGIGITIAMLAAGAAVFYIWCRFRRTGYTAARIGKFLKASFIVH